MKISNSKKKLAKIIHANGGWRDGANWSVQHKRHYGGRVVFTSRADKPEFETQWHADGTFFGGFDNDETLLGWHQTILSCDEYFHLYPVAKTELTADERCIQEAFIPEAKPTIEQLAADYRNRKDYADRKQQEADAAKADADSKLAELVAAGKAHGLVLSVAPGQKYTDRFYNAELGGSPEYSDDVRMSLCENCGNRFGLHYEDESYCRPRSERENA